MKKEIKNLNQKKFEIKIQWCGEPELYPLDNEPTSVEYKNQYYQSIKLISPTLDDKSIKKKFFDSLKTKELFIQEIGRISYSNLQEEVEKLKEKCSQGITAKDCEKCNRSSNKECITKLFSYSLGKEVLPHGGTELADCY